VNKALKRYTGITLDDLSGVGTEKLIYLNQYDAYYTYRSDCQGDTFICTSGERQDDIVRLYSENAILTLKQRDDGFWIVSHQPIREEFEKRIATDAASLEGMRYTRYY
jgi:hypothetical protein